MLRGKFGRSPGTAISPDVSPKPDSGKVQPFARMMNLAAKAAPHAVTNNTQGHGRGYDPEHAQVASAVGGLARTKAAERDPAALLN